MLCFNGKTYFSVLSCSRHRSFVIMVLIKEFRRRSWIESWIRGSGVDHFDHFCSACWHGVMIGVGFELAFFTWVARAGQAAVSVATARSNRYLKTVGTTGMWQTHAVLLKLPKLHVISMKLKKYEFYHFETQKWRRKSDFFWTMNKSTKSCQSGQNWHQKRKLRFGSSIPPPSARQVFIKSSDSIENLKNLTCCHNAAQITNVDLKPQSDFYLCQDFLSRSRVMRWSREKGEGV